jgi:hypothetical protein
MRARKNRPHVCINLVRTHNIPTMMLAKNANTEPNETTYNKSFMAFLLTPYRLNAATRFCSAIENAEARSQKHAECRSGPLQTLEQQRYAPQLDRVEQLYAFRLISA